MPVRLGSKLAPSESEARIEIVPLIDIMFFLLASFMLVSLSMVNLKTVKLDLPKMATASPEPREDSADISIDRSGGIYLDKKPVAGHELSEMLARLKKGQPSLRVIISGDRDAKNGDMMHVLDLVRTAGITTVSFDMRDTNTLGTP